MRLESRNWHLQGQFPWDSLVETLGFQVVEKSRKFAWDRQVALEGEV